MFLKRLERRKSGKGHTYWALVESIRTARGSRHRVVAYLAPRCSGIFPPWVFCQMDALVVALKVMEGVNPPMRVVLAVVVAFWGMAALLGVVYVGGVARRLRYMRFANS